MNAIFEHKENTMQWIKNILAGFFFKKTLQLKIYQRKVDTKQEDKKKATWKRKMKYVYGKLRTVEQIICQRTRKKIF